MRHIGFLVSTMLLMLLSVVPASAGIVGRHPPTGTVRPDALVIHPGATGPGLTRDLGEIRDRIDNARDTGALSRREARRLDREARQIDDLARRYGADGLSDSEKRELENRALYLRDALNVQRSLPTAPAQLPR